MILVAAALVLLGLGLFVGGLLTGWAVLYWGCVAACVVAAGLLVVARRRMDDEPSTGSAGAGPPTGLAPASPAADHAASALPPARPAADELPAADDAPAADGAHRTASTGAHAAAEDDLLAREDGEPVPTTGAHRTPEEGDLPTLGPPPTELSPPGAGEPPVEDTEVTDLLLVVDLREEVLVVDEHPRYHLPGCVHLIGQEAIPLPVAEARTDGFTPCGDCAPDRHLAEQVRARKAGG